MTAPITSRLPVVFLAAALLLTTGCATSSPSDATAQETAPPQAPEPTALEAKAVEYALHRAVNRARARHDRPPLGWSDSLRRLARGHSRDMARRDFFGHTNPDGETPTDRARRLGLPVTREGADGTQRTGVAENLFRSQRYHSYRDVYRQRGNEPRQFVRREYDWKPPDELARQTVEGWLESPTHRRTLLSPNYGRHGIGIATTEQRVYVTQNLF